ncbi:MAG: 3-methyl-2-oxobutanoate hydroxymethyltransferase [Planctomycetota bacterium]
MSTSFGQPESAAAGRRITVPEFRGLKDAGRKITMLTAYDFTMARLIDAAGVEGILVGDTLAMVVQGHETTLPVTLEEMIYHARMVGRAVEHALTVVDLPFPTFHLGPHAAVEAAARILKETRCQSVKLESGRQQAAVIAALVEAGIPVMAHCGLRPQSIRQLGGFRVQREEAQLLDDAKAAQDAGAFAVVLECIPAHVSARITAELRIPTIGIGAGAGCDGQVLVVHDLLGMLGGRRLKHVKAYADLHATILDAVTRYRDEVRRGEFPGSEHSFE